MSRSQHGLKTFHIRVQFAFFSIRFDRFSWFLQINDDKNVRVNIFHMLPLFVIRNEFVNKQYYIIKRLFPRVLQISYFRDIIELLFISSISTKVQ